MGLFSSSKICTVCESNKSNYTIADGNVCKECTRACGGFMAIKPMKDIYVYEIKNAIEQANKSQELENQFKVTKKIANLLFIDEEHKLLAITGISGKQQVYKIDDVLEYEILEDGNSITKGGLGTAVAGGLLFGGVGAIVGGITGGKKTKQIINKLQVVLTINNASNPSITLNLILMKTKADSIVYNMAYKQAQDIIATLSVLKSNDNTPSPVQQNNLSTADEIIKLKNLLDANILTNEEFIAQKNKILNS